MTENLRILVWEKKKRSLLVDRTLTARDGEISAEIMVGRHPENSLFIAHHALSPFHFKLRCQDTDPVLVPIPGTPRLQRRFEGWFPRTMLHRLRPPSPLIYIPEEGLRLYCGPIIFDFLRAHTVLKRPWRCLKPSATRRASLRTPIPSGLGFIVPILGGILLLMIPPWSPERTLSAPDPTQAIQISTIIPTPTPHLQVQFQPARAIRPMRPLNRLETAKINFLAGRETEAIAQLMPNQAESLMGEGMQARLNMAKTFKGFQRRRQVLAQSRPQDLAEVPDLIDGWKDLAHTEKALLQRTSLQTRALAGLHLAGLGRQAYRRQQHRIAALLFHKAREFDPESERVRHGLELLEKEAEALFRRAYLLAPTDPHRAQQMTLEALEFTAQGTPVHEKLVGLARDLKIPLNGLALSAKSS